VPQDDDDAPVFAAQQPAAAAPPTFCKPAAPTSAAGMGFDEVEDIEEEDLEEDIVELEEDEDSLPLPPDGGPPAGFSLLRRAAIELQKDAEWTEGVEGYWRENGRKFAAGERQLTWSALHQDYQLHIEGILEEALERLSPPMDAEAFLEELQSAPAQATSQLPPRAVLPLLAFSDYDSFEQMMTTLAQE